MSGRFRAVVEQWYEGLDHSLEHDAVVGLLREIAYRAGLDNGLQTREVEYDDVTVVFISDGPKFLDFLAQGTKGMVAARKAGRSGYELSQAEVREFHNMVALVEDWRKAIDPTDKSLRFYVD